MIDNRTSQAVNDLRKLEQLIRASDEVTNDDEDHDETLRDPLNYKYEILGHTEADWDSLELQLSPGKHSSVSTIEQLSRLAREEDQQLEAAEEKIGWQAALQVRNVAVNFRDVDGLAGAGCTEINLTLHAYLNSSIDKYYSC